MSSWFPPGGKTKALHIIRAMSGQEDYRHLGMESGCRSTVWLVFRNGKGVAQQEHLSQSSTLSSPSAEAGLGWLQTSTAQPGAPRPHTTIPDSPRKKFQHYVGWSKTAQRFQGVSTEFSGHQSS